MNGKLQARIITALVVSTCCTWTILLNFVMQRQHFTTWRSNTDHATPTAESHATVATKSPPATNSPPAANDSAAATENEESQVFYLKQPTLNLNGSCDRPRCEPISSSLNGSEIPKAPEWTMVTFVKSAAGHFHHRELLRRTWCAVSRVGGGRFATVFVTGLAYGLTATLLDEEHARYGDILQFAGSDDYDDIAYKTLAGMRWAAENLPPSYFYSSADDDFMVNMGQLQATIDVNIQQVKDREWPEYPIVCMHRRVEHWEPLRKGYGIKSKWAVPRSAYRWPVYPPSCLGGMYTTSVSVIGQLWRESRAEVPLKTDDVWLTGVVRQRLGMPAEMVVHSLAGVAYHYSSYRGKETDYHTEFMHKEWLEIYERFKERAHCLCRS